MYETHFGFHRQPFHSADASRAFFVSESIRTILPQLLHALRSDLGIAVLTGVPGSGKTSLLRHIQQQLSNEGRVIVCSGASLGTPGELVGVLLQASRMKAGSESLTQLNAAGIALPTTRSSAMEHMRRTAELWGPVLLLIDDVQLAPLAVLNELRACTEEEWNGRDLVRCLVSAPVTFEEQLARSEYAEFGRRIRCHTFLQPWKSVESVHFLQEQIELVGGRISHVLTAPALELIARAADGIPRCLSLLADETLVVAAECGEKTATEQAVRTALNRLQHLQYNWNASPHAGISELPLSHDEDTADKSIGHDNSPTIEIAQVTLPTTTPTVSRETSVRATPVRATLSPGVIEFGGPSPNAANVRPATQSPPRSITVASSHAVEPTIELAGREEGTVTSLVSEPTSPSEFEFGIPQAIADLIRSEPVAIRNEALAPFEVGRRFFAESSEDSISIEDVDDSEIVNLLNSESEFDREPWSVKDSLENMLPDQKPGFLKKPGFSEPNSANYFCAVPNTIPDTTSTFVPGKALSAPVQKAAPKIVRCESDDGPSEPIPSKESWALDRQFPGQPLQERTSATSKSTAHAGFIELDDSRMTNLTPVFDRYTWIAFGREFPPGSSWIDTQPDAKPLLLADCGILATRQLATLSLQTAPMRQMSSINQIPITQTEDSILIEEILQGLPRREEGSFELFREVSVYDEVSPACSGLRIWRDGQLMFAQSSDISGDQDVFPIVESVTSLHADIRQFQRAGALTGSDSEGTEEVVSPDEKRTPDAATLVSRAKRRPDDRTAVTDSAVVALQVVPDTRSRRTASEGADTEVITVAGSNPGSTPQFSRLFTRLWENRRRAADQAEGDAER